MRIRLSFFNRLKVRTKAIIAIVLIFVLLVSGALTILIQTGKLGSSAVSTIKTVTVSGSSTNPDTNKPNVGVPVKLLGGLTRFLAETTTDSMGKYSMTVQIDASKL